jgi:hypothetical protein
LEKAESLLNSIWFSFVGIRDTNEKFCISSFPKQGVLTPICFNIAQY